MKRKPKTRFHLISEAAFTAQLIELAQVLGWRVAHFRAAKTDKGWRTPVQGDGKGFPDLVLVNKKRKRLIIAELKSEDGRTDDEQDLWLEAFNEVRNVEVFVWRPSYIDEIEKILKG